MIVSTIMNPAKSICGSQRSCLYLELPCSVHWGVHMVAIEKEISEVWMGYTGGPLLLTRQESPSHQKNGLVNGPWTLTTNWLLTFSRICFSLSAMDSPFLFLILFFSKRLQAYILPVARTWQAQTCSKRKILRP